MSEKLSAQDFVHKWKQSELKEKSGYQSHFNDICRLIGHGTPAELDPKGDWFTFEAGANKLEGEQGWADVWKKGCFAWEYKGKHKALDTAYKQLLQYRESLLNPPLLVVSDMERFIIHTNFTNTAKHIYKLTLDDLLTKDGRDLLSRVFNDPESLKVPVTLDQVTKEAAREFAKLADILRKWGEDPQKTAHFLIRLLFCLFAEDIGLLPKELFTDLITQSKGRTKDFIEPLQNLFIQMAGGGYYGTHKIPQFDGQLFDDDFVLEVPSDGLDIIRSVCNLDWSSIEPAILGTLFERSLDPSSRAELGAHYTSRDDILVVVEPVLMAPLRRKWEEIKNEAYETKASAEDGEDQDDGTRTRLNGIFQSFMEEIASLKILDPACGSGNFLYVALQQLLGLQKEVITFAGEMGTEKLVPTVSPEQLYGIELNTYAFELAQTTIWIGYIQWMFDNGFDLPSEPILQPLHNFLNIDAVLAYSREEPIEPAWPESDVIIGNPPYLGNKRMRRELGDKYVDDLRDVYSGRLPGGCDLVCYWFEKSRNNIDEGKSCRAGLLATQSIRKGANREVLDRIKYSGDIFWAQSDRKWILDGATVHVSMVGFDDGSGEKLGLDDMRVDSINADLTAGIDLTQAPPLKENQGITFQGVIKAGPFDISEKLALKILSEKGNPNQRPNSDVIKTWYIGMDIADRPRNGYIIDFGVDMTAEDAAQYEKPFEYVVENVKPQRSESENWWRFRRPRPAMREAFKGLPRYIATIRHSKHRIFTWVNVDILPGSALVLFARDDDYFLGVLHSRVHELWSRVKGSQVREAESGFRYTPNSTFEPFPFPWLPGNEPVKNEAYKAIADATAELIEKREAWLNPDGLTEEELNERTQTNLYNENPTWLQHCHEKLDKAVLDAYGWPHDISDEEILKNLLALNEQQSKLK